MYQGENAMINGEIVEELKKTKALLEFKIKTIEGAIAALSKEHRDIINLIYIENKSRKEVCRRLFISENTLHRKRRKAVARIQELVSIIF